MVGEGSQDLQRRITERLKRAGWTRDDTSENIDWPEFEFDNGDASVELLYFPGRDWVRVGLLTEDHEGYLKVLFEDKMDAFLDVLIAAQGALGPERWELFIDELLAIPLRVYAVKGDDGDDLIEITPRINREDLGSQ